MYINSHLSTSIGMKIIRCVKTDSPTSQDYQFYLVQKGAIIINIYDEKLILQKDDVIIIKPDEQFTIQPYSPNTLIGIRLDSAYINSLIPVGYTIQCNSTKGPKKNFEQLSKIIIEICISFYKEDNETKMTSLIFSLSDYIKNHCIYKTNDLNASDIDLRNQERINEIVQRIQSHFTQPLSLSTLAEEMYFTPQYLSKFITKHLGVSFSRYLTNIRLQYAHIELIQTDKSITSIALNNGFPNVASFNKAFREKYQCSPSTYKQEYKGPDSTLPTHFGSSNKLVQADPDSLFKTMLNIDARTCVEFYPSWNNTINIGVLSNALSTNFQESFRKYHKLIPVNYVRFENLFSPQIITIDSAMDIIDFTNLNETLDFFYSLNVYPFIDLCSNQAQTKELQMFELKRAETKKYDMDYYYKALSKILKHSLHCYGREYVSKWRFEVTAHHDEFLKYIESPSLYLEKYKSFYSIIKGISTCCLVGGPGFNMCSDISIFQKYINKFSIQKINFDFISLFAYNYETKGCIKFDDPYSQGILSPDKDYIYNNFKKYEAVVKNSSFFNLPIYITDFGSALAFQNYIYDSMYQANLICKTMLSLLDDSPCIAYRSFWDTIPTLSFLENVYQSNSSLISKNGIPKPSLHAYTLLSRLGAKLISHSDKYIMTCDSKNKYQLLVFNYVHYTKSFCFNSWDPIKLENTYEILEEGETEEIHFICTNISSGRYKVTQISLNRRYGSALDEYLRILDKGNTTSSELLSTILNFTEKEAAYYRETSVPRHDIYYMNCQNQLELDIKLNPHEIIFFEFTKII